MVFDEDELNALVDVALDFWLTAGKRAEQFETGFAEFLGVSHCSLTNSGSSANLLAVSALTSPKLPEHERLKHGDEVITLAAAFPTTVYPIIQNGLVPVFLDVGLKNYNIQTEDLYSALSEKSKAIFISHTLGNPFDLPAVVDFATDNDLWLIEDACDALGSKSNGKYIGSFGDLSTYSFFPAHHISMGEGGAVCINDTRLTSIVESFRDWGKDCSCRPGQDNKCGHRFDNQYGTLPFGYDHKYVFSHIGYNLKITDMQAAIGVAQLKKLPSFIDARKYNFEYLFKHLSKYSNWLSMPASYSGTEPCWFGFPITLHAGTPFSRRDIVQYLESKKIATRTLFAGNILRQPSFTDNDVKYRTPVPLHNTDFIMENTFWIGVHPGLTGEMLEYIVNMFDAFMEEYKLWKYNQNCW